LTDDELSELTGYSWRSKQQHALVLAVRQFEISSA
jgi:hypothetical protein